MNSLLNLMCPVRFLMIFRRHILRRIYLNGQNTHNYVFYTYEETEMNDIEAILARHSVRNYKPDRIEEEKVKLLRERIEELNKEGNLHLSL